jgi:hypothetical protein
MPSNAAIKSTSLGFALTTGFSARIDTRAGRDKFIPPAMIEGIFTMKYLIVMYVLTNGQFVETGRTGDPMTNQPFVSAEKCNGWVNVMSMMVANKQPEAIGKIRLECKPS